MVVEVVLCGNGHVRWLSIFPIHGYVEMLLMILEEISSLLDGFCLSLPFLMDRLLSVFPGDNLIQQSVSLLQVKDPLFKRMGASRLSRFAIDGNVIISVSVTKK